MRHASDTYLPHFILKFLPYFRGEEIFWGDQFYKHVKLALLTRLSMDLLLLVLKIFFKVTSRKGISYRSSKINLLAVCAFNISSYGRCAFSVATPLLWNSLPQHITGDAGSLDILCAFLNWWFDCGFFHMLHYFIFSFCCFLSWFLNF